MPAQRFFPPIAPQNRKPQGNEGQLTKRVVVRSLVLRLSVAAPGGGLEEHVAEHTIGLGGAGGVYWSSSVNGTPGPRQVARSDGTRTSTRIGSSWGARPDACSCCGPSMSSPSFIARSSRTNRGASYAARAALSSTGFTLFRWVALSGDPADIAATDRAVLEEFPDDEGLARWIGLAGERVAFQGLPARICWLGYGERHRLGLRFNEMVRNGELKAPIVIGRDHLDSGSVASPYRETEAMLDGSDAIADWPLLNALVNTSSGATWVSIHHGGGVGIGRSIHAGMVAVADGTDLAAQKLERVLTNDPGMGVIRHADAGYERANEVAAERGVRIPMTEGDRELHNGRSRDSHGGASAVT